MLRSLLVRQKGARGAAPSAAHESNQQPYVDALRRQIQSVLQSSDWATAADCEERLIETEHNRAPRRRGQAPAPAQGRLARPPMNDTEMQAEQELVADVQRMARIVQARLRTDDSLAVWKQRREEIADLRRRIRAMRARHGGGSWTPSTMPPPQ